jgi:CHAT domain-containing protein
VIVPDGPLWELPFQALQRDGQRLLLDDHSLAYAPSLTALVEMRKARRPAASAAALFALAGSRAGNASSSAGEELGPDGGLEMRRQVEGLAGLYGQAASRVYVGTRATEDRLRDEAGRYAIVHLAAHGFFDDQNPLYSHLRLATSGHGDTPSSDGRLEAWEILEMGLPVRLAVLSACESGRSASGEGDGLLGLTWALFVAGCPATVVSQWNVDAASTTELMLEFHRRLRRGVSPAEALRRSALALRASPRYGHPFYWAPFMVVGDGGAAVLGGAPGVSPARLRRPSGPLRAEVLEEPARR